MAIVRFNPFREIELMQRQMNRLLDDQRAIPLPTRVQNNQVQAEFKHGVLCLTLPKAEEEKNRETTVNLLNRQAQSDGQSAPAEMSSGQASQVPQAF